MHIQLSVIIQRRVNDTGDPTLPPVVQTGQEVRGHVPVGLGVRQVVGTHTAVPLLLRCLHPESGTPAVNQRVIFVGQLPLPRL